MLILELAIILIAAKIAGHISVRFGQPSVLGQLIAGILIGPAVLGWVDNSDIIHELSNIGVIILMFIAGLETDLKQFKASVKASTYVGFMGVVFPLAGGYVLSSMLGMNTFEALFFGLVLSATSVSISVQTLREMNRLQSKEGMAILGAAVLDDIIVIILLAFLMSFMGGDVSIEEVILMKAAFFAVALLVAWKVVPWALSKLAAFRIPHAPIVAALLICFAYAYYAEATGVAAIIGAYLAGIAIGQTTHGHKIMEQAEIVGYSLFVPVFFVSIGFSAQISGLGEYVWLIVPLSVLAVLTKMIGGGLGAKFAGYEWMPSIRVGAGMVSRGEVALILASMGLKDGLLDGGLFTTLIIVVLVTTLVTPPLLKLLFTEKKKQPQTMNQSM